MVKLREQRLDEVYHALASTTRRRIVEMLAEQPLNISELAPEFDMSLTAVSKHVRYLEKAGIVSTTLKGRAHICKLKPNALRAAYSWLGGYEEFWHRRLDAFEKVLIEEQDETERG